jgi:hypothetical protein
MKTLNLSERKRARWTGALILAAYSMLTYQITGNVLLGFITDLISGLAVIGIPILLFPLLHKKGNIKMNKAYLGARIIEGILIISGGFFILNPSWVACRETIYNQILIHFFISGALLLYILLYVTRIVPRFISVWGIFATLILLVSTIFRLSGVASPVLDLLLIPMILNELFLAFWLILKGFRHTQLQGISSFQSY